MLLLFSHLPFRGWWKYEFFDRCLSSDLYLQLYHTIRILPAFREVAFPPSSSLKFGPNFEIFIIEQKEPRSLKLYITKTRIRYFSATLYTLYKALHKGLWTMTAFNKDKGREQLIKERHANNGQVVFDWQVVPFRRARGLQPTQSNPRH